MTSNITALHFDRIQNMAMDHQVVVTGNGNGVTSSTIYWLNVYDDRGGYVKWNMHDCYGDPTTIAGNIIAAYQQYQRYQQQNMQHP